MSGRTGRWAGVVLGGLVVAGCSSGDSAPAVGEAAPAMVAAAPEAPHPPGAWMMLDDGPRLWADSVAITPNADGSLRARLLRWGTGHWQVTVQDVRCASREVRWVADEIWDGDQQRETDPTADLLDEWQATTPGGPRGRIVEALCRLAGSPA